jgi:integrase
MAVVIDRTKQAGERYQGTVRKRWTVRYTVDGKQREQSFATKREADDFKAKFEHDSRQQLFIDPKLGNGRFGDAAERWLSRHQGTAKTKELYWSVLGKHLLPVLGDRTLRQVANDRDGVQELLAVTMPAAGVGPSMVQTARNIITSVIGDAIKSGKIASTRLTGIKIQPVPSRAEVVFASREQLDTMAADFPEPYGLALWLMRGCGLRLGEVLAVRGDSFRDGILRITEQRLKNGPYGPLKGRKAGDYRDVPVPGYVLAKLAETSHSDGYLFDGIKPRTYSRLFNRARDAAGLPESFTPHVLRHIFASVALVGGIPITDVSAWLGHKSIQTTFSIYGHLVPSSFDRARAVLDQEFASLA